jgi:hypothetical protein
MATDIPIRLLLHFLWLKANRSRLDTEVRVNGTDNPCIFSHVDLVSGARKQYSKRIELPSPACGGSRNFDNEGNSSDDCSMQSAIYDSRHIDEENNNSGDGMFTAVSNVSVESELHSNASQAHPTTIEIMVTAGDTYFDVDDNSDDDIEITFFVDNRASRVDAESPSLFLESWAYPSSTANVFDE